MSRRSAILKHAMIVCAAIPAAIVSGLCGGCGYSTHDEFAHIRSINVAAQRGDGTLIASRDTRPVLVQDAERPAVAMSTQRGRVTDQSSRQ